MDEETREHRGDVRRRADKVAKEDYAEWYAAHGRPNIRKYGNRKLAQRMRHTRTRRRLARRQ